VNLGLILNRVSKPAKKKIGELEKIPLQHIIEKKELELLQRLCGNNKIKTLQFSGWICQAWLEYEQNNKKYMDFSILPIIVERLSSKKYIIEKKDKDGGYSHNITFKGFFILFIIYVSVIFSISKN